MGSWGYGNFENDDAQDWLAGFVHGDNLKPVQEIFSNVKRLEDQYLEFSKCWKALAAAEVVAALRGYPLKDIPKRLATWLETHPLQVSENIVQEAMIVVVRILRDSELRDDNEDMQVPMEWYRVMGDLMSRLK
jgi:hypothetical protein